MAVQPEGRLVVELDGAGTEALGWMAEAEAEAETEGTTTLTWLNLNAFNAQLPPQVLDLSPAQAMLQEEVARDLPWLFENVLPPV